MLLFKNDIPNALSILRIALSLVFPILIYYELLFYAMLIFTIAALTDFFDGHLARKWKVQSSFGSKIDPLADKILMAASYLSLYFMKWIPFYVTSIVILRDILILSAVILCMINKISVKIDPLFVSKLSTTIQIIYIVIILSCKGFSINVPLIVDICSLIVCLSTLFSAIEYIKKYYWIKHEIQKLK